MKKKIVFWCPFISKVGTINAVMESAKALANSKKFECKIINVFGEFDDYNYIIKKNKIKEVKLIKNRFLLKLPKEGYFWSRLNFVLIMIFGFFPLFLYLKKNSRELLFVYLLSSLPFLVISIFKLKNRIIFRISGKVNFSYLRKKIWLKVKKNIQRILVQTNYSKKKLIGQKIFDQNKIIFLGDPIIDINYINKIKKKKLKKNIYLETTILV